MLFRGCLLLKSTCECETDATENYVMDHGYRLNLFSHGVLCECLCTQWHELKTGVRESQKLTDAVVDEAAPGLTYRTYSWHDGAVLGCLRNSDRVDDYECCGDCI